MLIVLYLYFKTENNFNNIQSICIGFASHSNKKPERHLFGEWGTVYIVYTDVYFVGVHILIFKIPLLFIINAQLIRSFEPIAQQALGFYPR